MNINEVAGLLGLSKEKAQALISEGLVLPKSGVLVKLEGAVVGGQLDVTDEQLDAFIARFAAEEPIRNPPTAVRRELMVEARHRCAVCGNAAPLQFHHMIDWAKVKHHDPSQMLAVCGTCHDLCGNGDIDYKAQLMYKARLKERDASVGPVDEHAATRRASDKKTLGTLFGALPRPLVSYFLDKCLIDQIHHDILTEAEPAEQYVQSLTFHLYDQELWKLVRGFFTEWFNLQEDSKGMFHDSLSTGIALRIHWTQEPPDFQDRYESFHRHVVQAHHAFRLLNAYVRDQFPDLDLDQLDEAGVARYVEWTDNIKKEVAEVRDSLRKHKQEAQRAKADKEANDEAEGEGPSEATSGEATPPSTGEVVEEANDPKPPPAGPLSPSSPPTA